MTQPPADPPPVDPDADLSDDEKATKTQVKRWVGEALRETITAMKDEDPGDPPKRTKKPDKGAGAATLFNSLFGG